MLPDLMSNTDDMELLIALLQAIRRDVEFKLSQIFMFPSAEKVVDTKQTI